MPPAKTTAVWRVRRRWLKRRRVVSPTGVSSHRTMLRSPFGRSLRRIPREDLARHMETVRTAEVVDRPPAARVEACLGQVPLRQMLRIRNRFPHGFDGMPDGSLEGQGREVALEGETACARTARYRHRDPFL